MTLGVQWTDSAAKDMRRIAGDQARRVREAVIRLAETAIGDVRKLAGRQDEWRLRVGDYRVLFGRGVNNEDAIVVLAVRHRREAYCGS